MLVERVGLHWRDSAWDYVGIMISMYDCWGWGMGCSSFWEIQDTGFQWVLRGLGGLGYVALLGVGPWAGDSDVMDCACVDQFNVSMADLVDKNAEFEEEKV
ncbi:hypothetical protein E3N88_22921 [Mikania micrantha]|uniref:Uncharacterized protein n=1 Tax=Mikania micrantha TaxID=192012 RepID=A0A5N6NDJ4_9ASTR|nr:hypothetical protein E3N88_22921 [Mikania micrantha]